MKPFESQHVLDCVDAQSAEPESLGLKCILGPLFTSGIRLEELANARHKDLQLESMSCLPEAWILTVTEDETRRTRVH